MTNNLSKSNPSPEKVQSLSLSLSLFTNSAKIIAMFGVLTLAGSLSAVAQTKPLELSSISNSSILEKYVKAKKIILESDPVEQLESELKIPVYEAEIDPKEAELVGEDFVTISDKKVKIRPKKALKEFKKLKNIKEIKYTKEEIQEFRKNAFEEKKVFVERAEAIMREPLRQLAEKERFDQRIQKAKQIKTKLAKMLKENKVKEISFEDMAELEVLDEKATELGLTVIPAKSSTEKPQIIYEPKQNTLKVSSFWEDFLNFGSLNAQAFAPEYSDIFMNVNKLGVASKLAMDLSYGNQNNGTQINSVNKSGAWNQKWSINANHQIKINGTNKCLDLSAGNKSVGAKIQIWDCDTNNKNQKWAFDTEGRLRLIMDTTWCVDTDRYTTRANPLYLNKCLTGNVVSWRAGDFQMTIISRVNNRLSRIGDFGHTFVALAKYDGNNKVSQLTTYSLWPDKDNVQNNPKNYKAFGDSGNNENTKININHNSDLSDAYDVVVSRKYNKGSADYKMAYWDKFLTNQQYNYILNEKGFRNIGWNQYDYNLFTVQICSSYSIDFWNWFNGRKITSAVTPVALYDNELKFSRVYAN